MNIRDDECTKIIKMDFDLDNLKKQLIKRGFDSVICNNKQEAVDYILETFSMSKEMVIGMGNSLTLDSLGLKENLIDKVSAIYSHVPGSSEDETKKALLSDLYLTSANAISYDGQIINIDGTGNRTAATCYGPDKVVYVIGKNKIAKSLDEAINRARNTAAVQNAKRYNRKTPCAVTGKCEDCLSPECICGVITIHRKQPNGPKITVVLVDEDLGL